MGSASSSPSDPLEEIAINVVYFLDDHRDVSNAFQVCKGWASISKSELAWRNLCERLAKQYPVALASDPPPLTEGPAWKAVFLEGWNSGMLRDREPRPLPRRECDSAACAVAVAIPVALKPAAKEGVPIRVCVRFRAPSTAEVIEAADGDSGGAGGNGSHGNGSNGSHNVLPLHQRLQLLKLRHGCSASEAQRLVWAGAKGTGDPWSDADPRESGGLRDADGQQPASVEVGGGGSTADSSLSEAAEDVATGHSAGGLNAAVLDVQPRTVLMMAPTVGLRQFTFDAVLDGAASQPDAYAAVAAPAVAAFLNGENATVFCYGQTGSGKTHTMGGPDAASASSLAVSTRSGIVPRAARDVLDSLSQRASTFGLEWHLALSFVEIYGDEVTDLLRAGSRVGAWAGVAARAVDAGLAEVTVGSAAELEEALRCGDAAKRRAATAMNDRSSRAHSLLIFSLRMRLPLSADAPPPPPGGAPPPSGEDRHPWINSRLYLVDLGGSEKVHKSGASADARRMAEAVKINLGLLALRNCIAALVDGESHVPYNTSRLTQLMQRAFAHSGRSRAVLAVTCRLDAAHAQETLQSLRFGEDAARIVTAAGAAGGVQQAAAGALSALNAQLATLTEEERWEGGKPVGAEAARAQYETLLAARKALLGEEGGGEMQEDEGGDKENSAPAAASGRARVGAKQQKTTLAATSSSSSGAVTESLRH